MKPIIFTLTGPTCAGKSTLEKLMVERLDFANIVSTTTRAKRDGEQDGVNYYFKTKEQFADMIDNDELVEAVKFNDDFYGVGIEEVNRITALGKPIVVVVEPGGRRQVQDYCNKHGFICKSIYVDASVGDIAARFIERTARECCRALSQLSDIESFGKLLAAQGSRLSGMLSHERGWIVEATQDIANPYAYVIRDFDEHKNADVIKHIASMLVETFGKAAA